MHYRNYIISEIDTRLLFASSWLGGKDSWLTVFDELRYTASEKGISSSLSFNASFSLSDRVPAALVPPSGLLGSG